MSCERHDNQCAYDGTEPELCPRCHRSWARIGGYSTRAAHEALHDQRDEVRARDVARSAARRAAA